MNKPFCFETALNMESVDFTGHWQPGAVFRTMQEASNAHCVTLKADYQNLYRHGLAFVLTRALLRMDEYPALDDKLIIQTWPTANRHMFFPRHYIFQREDGREIGRSTTYYVLIDIETRKIAMPGRLPVDIPAYDIPAPLPMPGNIALPETEGLREDYAPVYTDFDMNGHVNNTRYIDWYMNRFPCERHQNEEVAELLIHYHHEVRRGEALTLDLREKDEIGVLQGLSGGELAFAVQGTWRQRP